CENIDWNVGRVLKTLKDLKLRDDTIVVYFSDNGPNSYRWNSCMKGRKGSIDEGGLRSPFFIRWPGHITAGATIPHITGAIDLLPTLIDLAGVKLQKSKPLDGRNLVPLLQQQDVKWKPRSLFSIRKNQVSVRTQRFRLDASGQLFDIATDPGQHRNVADRHPKLVTQLRQQSKQHGEEMKLCFEASDDRPFHVGYGPSTTLPARDGVEHGTIKRSAKPPNNSFFTNWTSTEDYISWQVDVAETGNYAATVYYTCAAGNEGAT
ncbi:MAG: sulfatase-like hydrolase/transferase, partial [Fuerstiella sp.]|nr:sulfatase-like hydrolase/transferase [Fuerstiella sp.]